MMKIVTRRVFLLLVFDWLFFWRRYTTLAGVRFRRIVHGSGSTRYVLIHGNEETAREVLKAHMKQNQGTAYLVTSDERNVRIKDALIDPNRMFSRTGAERSLRRLNANLGEDRIRSILDHVDRERPDLIRALMPSSNGLLIATHNNSEGYSVKDEVAASDKVSLKQPDLPHEFFLCTDPFDFEKIAAGPYNVVLQRFAPQEDDGSLSRLAARMGVRYCNLEVALGNARAQTEMLDWLVKTLA
jgi:hypothetical protein